MNEQIINRLRKNVGNIFARSHKLLSILLSSSFGSGFCLLITRYSIFILVSNKLLQMLLEIKLFATLKSSIGYKVVLVQLFWLKVVK